jgi:hypothetical protein
MGRGGNRVVELEKASRRRLPFRGVDNVPKQHSILDEHPEWLAEFEAAARRPLATRLKYAFVRTYKPVLDDARYRSFESMAEYRRWCEENLPPWLGYGRV